MMIDDDDVLFLKQQRHTCLLPRIQIRSSIDTLRVPDMGTAVALSSVLHAEQARNTTKTKGFALSKRG